MRTSLALVHHANQYLITEGYDNREGIEAIIGAPGGSSGFRRILQLHQELGIPLNLHISGTLLEAIAWHAPGVLDEVRLLLESGLIELVGSCYGQNIMRFFGPEYNRRQLNEELLLYRIHLGADPADVKTFWPPERVWDTRRMAPVLRDARLLNDGYRFVILDDRLLLDPDDPLNPRGDYDESGGWDPELFRMHEIADGIGLVAFPIATRLRRSIPPNQEDDWSQVQSDLEGLLVHAADENDFELLAMYADDMEKVSGRQLRVAASRAAHPLGLANLDLGHAADRAGHVPGARRRIRRRRSLRALVSRSGLGPLSRLLQLGRIQGA
jgi:hypothetical protein